MKFRTETRQVQREHIRDGRAHMITEDVQVQVPVPPIDLDVLALRAVGVVVMVMTLASIAWSTVSIGALLHGGIGYAAAALFDASWMATILLEWLSRFDPAKRHFAKVTGWVLLGITMGAILWHGLLHPTPAGVALGVVGAMVSAVAKVMWLGVMRHVHKDLSSADLQWVAAETSAANAKLAIAGVRRQVARADSRAVADLLAAELIRDQFSSLLPKNPEQAAPAAIAAEPITSADLQWVTAETSAANAKLHDAMAARRHDVTTPAGTGAELRPEPTSPQLSRAVPAPVFLPESRENAGAQTAEPEPEAAEIEDDAQEEPEPRVPEQRPRPTMRAAIDSLMSMGVTDPKAIAATLPALIGREPNSSSVSREIRAAKARLNSQDEPNGPYL